MAGKEEYYHSYFGKLCKKYSTQLLDINGEVFTLNNAEDFMTELMYTEKNMLKPANVLPSWYKDTHGYYQKRTNDTLLLNKGS